MKKPGDRKFLSVEMAIEDLVRILEDTGFLAMPLEGEVLPDDARVVGVHVKEFLNILTIDIESDELDDRHRFRGWRVARKIGTFVPLSEYRKLGDESRAKVIEEIRKEEEKQKAKEAG